MKRHVFEALLSLQNEKIRIWSVFQVCKNEKHVFEAFFKFKKMKKHVF